MSCCCSHHLLRSPSAGCGASHRTAVSSTTATNSCCKTQTQGAGTHLKPAGSRKFNVGCAVGFGDTWVADCLNAVVMAPFP